MSKATKRKHVAKEVLDDYVVPDPNQQIVKVGKSRIVIALLAIVRDEIACRSIFGVPPKIFGASKACGVQS